MLQVIINSGDLFGSLSMSRFPFKDVCRVFDEVTFTEYTITFLKKDGSFVHINGHYPRYVSVNGRRIPFERVVLKVDKVKYEYVVQFDIHVTTGDIVSVSEHSDRIYRY